MSIDELRQLITLNSALFGGAGFFLGLYIGHRLALGRDRRNEYNEIIEPLRERLVKQRDEPGVMSGGTLSSVELDRLDPYLWRWNRRRVREANDRCKKAREYLRSDRTGQPFLMDPNGASKASADLLALLPKR
jgi:hypothetical protein